MFKERHEHIFVNEIKLRKINNSYWTDLNSINRIKQYYFSKFTGFCDYFKKANKSQFNLRPIGLMKPILSMEMFKFKYYAR